MSFPPLTVWTVIAAMAVGTFLIRFSFIGLIGSRTLPEWVLRHLRYAPVAVIPALVTPLVLFPAAAGGSPDPARLAAAAATLAVGVATRSVLAAILAGIAALYLGLWIAA
jgi:branched-subunit amino acid transport protein